MRLNESAAYEWDLEICSLCSSVHKFCLGEHISRAVTNTKSGIFSCSQNSIIVCDDGSLLRDLCVGIKWVHVTCDP
jgi:hypothetical protein